MASTMSTTFWYTTNRCRVKSRGRPPVCCRRSRSQHYEFKSQEASRIRSQTRTRSQT